MKTLIPNAYLTAGQTELKCGHAYIVHDAFEANFKLTHSELLGDVSFKEFFSNKPDAVTCQDYNGKHLLVLRPGGYGDILFIARSIQELKRQVRCHVTLACDEQYMDVICLLPQFDDIVPTPLPHTRYQHCDYFFPMERAIEYNPRAITNNAFDLMAEHFKVTLDGAHTVSLAFSPEKGNICALADSCAQRMETTGEQRKIVGIQIAPSTWNRAYPLSGLLEIIHCLAQQHKVLLIGSKEQRAKVHAHLAPNMREHVFDPDTDDFLFAVALARHCDLIIAPDSVFVYVADSFGIPVIAYYSNIDSSLRVKHMDVYAIETMCRCHNCNEHSAIPCLNSSDSYSPCIKSIKPRTITDLANKILAERR